MTPHFHEEQRFTQWWLWLLLVVITAIPVVGLYFQVVLGKPFGDNPMSNAGLVYFALFMLAVLFLFWFVRLYTDIDHKTIRLEFYPFIRRKFSWSDVESAKIVDYEYVGYGLRVGSKYGKVFNMRGRKGLALQLRNGERLVIGTQRESELRRIIDRYFFQKES